MNADDTDAVFVGTWPYLHCPATLAALAAGKHVFTQARMAMNASEARKMLAAARRNPHLVTQICPAPHTLAVDRTVRRLIVEGYLGDVLAIEICDTGAFIDRDAPLHWRNDESLSGMNIMSMGMLYETILKWVGPATRIAALASTFVQGAPGRRRHPARHRHPRSPGGARRVGLRCPTHPADLVGDGPRLERRNGVRQRGDATLQTTR